MAKDTPWSTWDTQIEVRSVSPEPCFKALPSDKTNSMQHNSETKDLYVERKKKTSLMATLNKMYFCVVGIWSFLYRIISAWSYSSCNTGRRTRVLMEHMGTMSPHLAPESGPQNLFWFGPLHAKGLGPCSGFQCGSQQILTNTHLTKLTRICLAQEQPSILSQSPSLCVSGLPSLLKTREFRERREWRYSPYRLILRKRNLIRYSGVCARVSKSHF